MPLPPRKPSQTGQTWPTKAPKPATRAAAGSEPGGGEEHGRRALEPVAEEGGGGERLVAGPQHVGGADIARADGADVAEAGEAGEDQAEGNGAEEVADDERHQRIRADGKWHETSPPDFGRQTRR